MRYDDDAIERALAALPMEETPADLHARILHAVAQRPQPAFRTWELWILGGAFAICVWLVMALFGAPFTGGREVIGSIATWSQHLPQLIVSALTPSALWLAVGAAATYLTIFVYRPFERVPIRRQ